MSYLSGESIGHYNLQMARVHNELMRQLGQPLPHPTLPQLAPRSNAQYGTAYEAAEIERQHKREEKARLAKERTLTLAQLEAMDPRAHTLAIANVADTDVSIAASSLTPAEMPAHLDPSALAREFARAGEEEYPGNLRH